MNAVDVGAWNANWAWSLPLIVLNAVIHVIGLGLINESVVRVLSGAVEQRRFMPTFVVGMGVAALLAAVLHGTEDHPQQPFVAFISSFYKKNSLRCKDRPGRTLFKS